MATATEIFKKIGDLEREVQLKKSNGIYPMKDILKSLKAGIIRI